MTVPARMSFVTLGARDLPRLRDFYKGLGWHPTVEADNFAAFLLGGVVLGLYAMENLNAEAAPGKPAGQEAAPPVASAPVARVADPAEDVVILDVRGMEPPEPMAHTLAALETLPAGKTLLQINERVPQFLLPRLSELGFEYTIREQEEGVVRVFIRRSADAEASDPHPDSGPASR